MLQELGTLGIAVSIGKPPCEIPNAVPFALDRSHSAYDAEQVQRFWREAAAMMSAIVDGLGIEIQS